MTVRRPSLRDVLDLRREGPDSYRSCLVYQDGHALYGGQVAAQALVAAGSTVAGDRVPHSLHLYFLRGGDASQPTDYRVERDRDGRMFSARRVIALQGGRVLATMACSFTVEAGGPDLQVAPAPAVPDPAGLSLYPSPRMFGFESRLPAEQVSAEWPTQFWSRVFESLPDDRLAHAAALTYLSDRSNGIGGLDLTTRVMPVSLDHAVWFHRPVQLDDWVLMTLVPHTLAAERAWYSGTLHDRSGVLVASMTQEVLARPAPGSEGPTRQ